MPVKLEATSILSDATLERDPFLRSPWITFESLGEIRADGDVAGVALKFTAWVIGYGDAQAHATYPTYFDETRATLRLTGGAALSMTFELPEQFDHFAAKATPLPYAEFVFDSEPMCTAPDGTAWTIEKVDALAALIEQGVTWLPRDEAGRVAWFMIDEAWLEVALKHGGNHELVMLRSASA